MQGPDGDRPQLLLGGVEDELDRDRVAALPVARAAEDHRHDPAAAVDDRPAALPRPHRAPQRDDDPRRVRRP